ncbi:MAG TPA: metal-dependent hydrolase [Oligoflexus sp.]|uniref:metal-dependent hydrolase n=1 Tax=Oligoflexus sp. TaxID=1971216 RepID=UPI002D568076|nr:metal-dependent hydrolase [Oligoflexus sp.]HYX32433.1 metal-dependent hydrolase [Oligoflexus sp.]
MKTFRSTIHIRSIQPRYEATPDLHWFGGNPFVSHLVHALSFLFPPGEAMFVRSVNHFKDKVTDPDLRRAIKAFAGQEHLHSQSHYDFNLWIQTRIPEAHDYCQRIAAGIDRNYARMEKKKPIVNLAVTVALEHITAVMAATFLSRPDMLEKIHPEIRSLFIWHAIEEIEHKSVAFDVYQSVGGTYATRIWGLVVSTLLLVSKTLYYQGKLLQKDGQLSNWRAGLSALRDCFGGGGFFTVLRGRYLDFFRRDFHPSQHDDRDLVETWQGKLSQLTTVKVIGRVEVP